MSASQNNALAVTAARARDTSTSTAPAFCDTSDFAQTVQKALAVWLYNVGACSLEETQGAFKRRPEWARA